MNNGTMKLMRGWFEDIDKHNPFDSPLLIRSIDRSRIGEPLPSNPGRRVADQLAGNTGSAEPAWPSADAANGRLTLDSEVIWKKCGHSHL
jgi:hypothetical protein